MFAQPNWPDFIHQQLDAIENPQEKAELLNLFAYQHYRENVKLAKSYAQAARKISEANQLDQALADSYVNLGRCYRLENDWDSAIWVLEKAIEGAHSLNYDEGLMHASNNLGAVYLIQWELESAKPYFDSSFQYAQAIGSTKGQANALNNLAIISSELSREDTTLDFFNQALVAYEALEDSTSISRTLVNIATVYDALEQNDTAISLHYKALHIQEILGLDYQKSFTLDHIADLFIQKAENQRALGLYRQSLTIREHIGDISGLAASHGNVGSTLEYLDSLDAALPHLEKSLEYAQQSGDPELIGASLVNLGNGYNRTDGDAQKAYAYYSEAQTYLEAAESPLICAMYNGLGEWAMAQNKLDLALSMFQKELREAIDFEELDSQQYALYHISEIYRRKGNIQQALYYADQYHDIKDSVISIASLERINQLNIAFETEKKERKNLQLEKDLTEKQLESANRKAQFNLILLISGIVFVVGMGGFIWYRYQQRMRLKEQAFELEQERARKEQKRKEAEKLRELDAMKTRFFTNISHEFRTPLTLILGQNEQLQELVKAKPLQSRFQMVDRNAHRLLDLINQVLDVAKLEAGGMQLEMVRLNAMPFFKNMLYSFESMAYERGIQLTFESELEALQTAFDPKKLERVLFNLLSNALKFTPKGGNIEMTVAEKDQQVDIAISDTGQGIKAEQLPYIFDRFYQADSSDHQPQPGTGIGLSLVKELVELHGGSISVESKINQGTRFSIAIPIPENLQKYPAFDIQTTSLDPAAVPTQTNIPVITGPADSDGRQAQLLIIEDNPDVRSYVRDQLIQFGYHVLEAEDGVEGLTQAQEHLPDLIISDIMMPNLDGYGVAKGIREDVRTSHIPLILLTSKASEKSKITGFESGIDDYLLKPFNSRELQARVQNLIQQRQHLRQRFSEATIIRPNEVSPVSMDQQFLKSVLETIEQHLTDEQFGVEILSLAVGMSVTHLNRKLRALVDQPAGKLIRSMRLQRAADLLKQQAGTISDIAYQMGFSSPTHFTRSFKKQFGLSPSEYVKSV